MVSSLLKKQKKGTSGLSGHHKVSYGASIRKSKSVPLNKTGAQIKARNAQLNKNIAALSFVQRKELFGTGHYDIEMPDAPDYSAPDGWHDADSDEEEALQTLPPGEEGLYHSNEGKEASFERIFENCRPGRVDLRRRTQRVQQMVNAWNVQMPFLVDAYLQFKHEGAVNSDDDPEAWSIEVIGFEAETHHCFVHTGDAMRANQTLIQHGYLGASPEKVSLAFPIRLFEIYRQIHRVCPRYSIGALCTTLTNLHQGPRRPALAERLSTAYDAYLEIMRRVDACTDAAMGRDNAWHIQNVCAPCLYKINNETPLRFSWLGCMDGNSSLKLVDATFWSGSVRPDNRSSTSFRWLSPEQVDVFKDEVTESQKKARSQKRAASTTDASASTPPIASTSTQPTPLTSTSGQPTALTSTQPLDIGPTLPVDDDGDTAWLNINELNSAETDELTKSVDTCVERWKAAGPEARKKMFTLFTIAGIFLTVCRHGHVVVMCDMIRSGELMKYPLAMVKWMLDHYGGDIGLGYDIMCAFWKTLKRSSLGAKVTAMRWQGVVPAFHGHAHNRPCQIGWHPVYVDGVGLEDFEECERTFSLSNHLAASTRLATAFHRQQQINEHFQFHDQDKHAASGNFIYQNYRQALEKISLNRSQLSVLELTLGTSADDYKQDHIAEVQYFESLRSEPQDIQHTSDYVEWLQKHTRAVEASDQAKLDFQRLDFNIINNGYTTKQIAAVRTRYRTMYAKLVTIEEGVCRFEEEHCIEVRWATDSAQYQEALAMTTDRKYKSALDLVERLVVQRLFEMTKLGMSGLAYKLRDQISKALKTRSEAIRRAILVLNEAGAGLTPPREALSFAEVVSIASLAEFDLLRETRRDIGEQAWTQPTRRQAGTLYFGIKRAKEEVQRLNVEISRLLTFLIDEHVDYYKAISATLLANPPLATELQRHWFHATRIGTSIVKRLASVGRLTGFSGSFFPGVREGRDPERGDGVPPPHWLAAVLGIEQLQVEYDENDGPTLDTEPEYNEEQMDGLVIRELDVGEENLVELMEHLSTFVEA
ncbi:hypothetical protein C8R44DRAFT_892604 [Mycena epipterygia]|nr:hypothetical protein C8R44DRAFT_892604 [Mycena epipterygia]